MNPWQDDPAIADQQREFIAHQLAERPWPVHFTALADAIRALVVHGNEAPRILEVGCGVGHGSVILDAAIGFPSRSGYYAGIDISERAIAIARELYPDCMWYCVDAKTLPTFDKRDIVIDGSCVLHIEDWRAHLEALCGVSKDAVILHRLPVLVDLPITLGGKTQGYGHDFKSWLFSLEEVVVKMYANGFGHIETRKADGDSYTLTFRRVDR